MTETRIAEIDADVEIYTDGSIDGMQRKGGAGVFMQGKEGKMLLERAKPAGRLFAHHMTGKAWHVWRHSSGFRRMGQMD